MNVLILGAGASRGTHDLPVARDALARWASIIRIHYKLLAFALDVWVPNWPQEDLEAAWSQIDLAWTERAARAPQLEARDLTDAKRRRVWQLASDAKAKERIEPNYYGPQIAWAQELGHSAEAFLSVVAGWELRHLIQRKLVIPLQKGACAPYKRVRLKLRPATVISFNYDTLFERSLDPGAWVYAPSTARPHQISILKPHGSVDWIHRVPLRRELADQVQFGEAISPNEMGYREGWLVQNLVVGLRKKIEHTTAEPSPVIRTLFLEILTRCERALTEAQTIWVVGYRFAEADTGFLDVLARSLASRPAPPSISIIGKLKSGENPKHLLSRIRDVFSLPAGAQLPHCFCGFKTWARHGFCHS